MGPGIDPHMYRARESDIHKLACAHLIFYNGLHLEGKMADIFAALPRHCSVSVYAVSDAVAKDTLLYTQEGVADPHIWHDVTLWLQVVQSVVHVISAADPDHAQEYAQQADQYCKQLYLLDQYLRVNIETIPPHKRILITAHDAFNYFGRAYGITVVGLQGISTQVQVGTRDIAQLADYIIQHDIPVLFVESSISDRTLTAVMQAVASRGWQVTFGDELYSDALGLADSPSGTYKGMMMHNAQAIVKGLRAHSHE
jgi:manganese/zinc/iron transport system substrate-binding protein